MRDKESDKKRERGTVRQRDSPGSKCEGGGWHWESHRERERQTDRQIDTERERGTVRQRDSPGSKCEGVGGIGRDRERQRQRQTDR